MKKSLVVAAGLLLSQSVFAQNMQFGFTSESVLTAPCKTKVPLSDQELVAWVKSLDSEPLPWVQVGKKTFKNENVELAFIYRQLLAKDDSKTEVKVVERKQPDGTKKYEVVRVQVGEETFLDVNTKSDNVLGSLQEIFGKRQGLQLAYLLHKYRFNGSHLRYRNVSALKTDELDDLILAAADLPQQYLPGYFDQQMTKFLRGYTRAGNTENVLADTMGGERVNYFDSWASENHEMRQTTIVHELGHVVAHLANDLDESREWEKTSKWSADKRDLQGPKVTSYAGSQPVEDFAESFTAYIYAPEYLKRNFPEKFNLLKEKVFAGREYTKNSSCDGAISQQSLEATASDLAKVRLNPVNMSEAVKTARTLCAWGAGLNSCLSQVLKDQLLKDAVVKTEKISGMDPIQRRKNLVRVVSVPTQAVQELRQRVAAEHAAKIAKIVSETVGLSRYYKFERGLCGEVAYQAQFALNGDKTRIDSGEIYRVEELKNIAQKTCEQTAGQTGVPITDQRVVEIQARKNLM